MNTIPEAEIEIDLVDGSVGYAVEEKTGFKITGWDANPSVNYDDGQSFLILPTIELKDEDKKRRFKNKSEVKTYLESIRPSRKLIN